MKFFNKFARSDLRNYETCFTVIDEIRQTPKLQETLFKKREHYLKLVFSLEGEKKLQMEGRIMELNDILNIQDQMKYHINTFRAVARENESDIDSELEDYQLNN